MRKYKVSVENIYYLDFSIEAKNKSEAIEKAELVAEMAPLSDWKEEGWEIKDCYLEDE